MSLINDALKRTQNHTRGDVPPRLDTLELRPIDPSQPPPQRGGGARMLIWIMVLVVILGNVALFVLFKTLRQRQAVAARTAEEELVVVPDVVEPTPEPAPIVTPAAEPELAADGAPVPEMTPTNTVVLDPPQPDRPEFKLKTVVTHPTRPSAMINNRVVFVGDRVAGYSVVAIGQDEVTLRLDGDEVVVSLP